MHLPSYSLRLPLAGDGNDKRTARSVGTGNCIEMQFPPPPDGDSSRSPLDLKNGEIMKKD